MVRQPPHIGAAATALAAAAAALFGLSCRDIQPVQPPNATKGYQLNGTVATPSGLALDSVEVRTFYYFELTQDTPVDTQQVVVRDTVRLVDVSAYTTARRMVSNIYRGLRPPGPVPHFLWDARDSAGAPVPGGKYLVGYAVGGAVVKYSTVIVDGHTTATTGPTGRFTIAGDRLPVGEVYDYYNLSNEYSGTYRVQGMVDLTFRKGLLFRTYTNVTLQKDIITTAVFTLE